MLNQPAKTTGSAYLCAQDSFAVLGKPVCGIVLSTISLPLRLLKPGPFGLWPYLSEALIYGHSLSGEAHS